MKALLLTAYGRLEYADVPDPEPGPEEVVVAVRACGICGSDVHGMDGSTGRRQPPIIMGHEAAGVIAAAGTGEGGWTEGDRVTFDSTIYCGACPSCVTGRRNLCDNRQVLGVSCAEYRRHGAFAEFVAVPRRVLYRLPEGLPFEHAALAEPAAVALHAVRRTPMAEGESALVIGAGMIGMLVVQALRMAGSGPVTVMDIDETRLGLAAAAGASHAVNAADADAEDRVREVNAGQGVDRVFEAVGIPDTLAAAIRLAHKGGSVTLIGNLSPTVEFPLQAAVTRELSVFGSCASNGEYPAAIEQLGRREINVAPLISAVAPLSEGAGWFRRLYEREAGLMKVVLRPEAASGVAVAGAPV